MFLYYWKLEFSELHYRPGQKEKNMQVWYYFRMWLLLVLCLIVIIFPVLCLLYVLCFISSLRKEICSRSEEPHWPHHETSLIAGNTVRCCCPHPQDFQEKLWLCVATHRGGGRLSPSSCPVSQCIRKTSASKHYSTTAHDSPWAMLCWMEKVVFRTHKSN